MLKKMSRRDFARLAFAGAGVALLSNCAGDQLSPGSKAPGAPGSVPPPPTGTSGNTPTAAPPQRLLTNENVPGFYVRYYRPFEGVDPNSWTLSVEGLVRRPQKLSLSNVRALPRVSQVSRMKCVECWSAPAAWEGIHLSTLMELVDPEPKAQWVRFLCADGYYESMSIEALLHERVLFAHGMNGDLLPDLYGAPLRLLVPFLYGYKSAKAIVTMEFSEKQLTGFWPDVGPYTEHGSIEPGRDNPLDLEGTREIQGGGEIFYPDGIEYQDKGES